MTVLDHYPTTSDVELPEHFHELLRECVAWRAGREHYPAWEAADAAIARGLRNVHFDVDADGVDFGFIGWRPTADVLYRCKACGERAVQDAPIWWRIEPDDNDGLCKACVETRYYQTKQRCVGCGRRGVANNGRYCLDCVIEGKREVLDFLTSLAREAEPMERELDTEWYDESMIVVRDEDQAKVHALANERNEWGALWRRCAPEDRVFAGDWAFQPLYGRNHRWIVVKWERTTVDTDSDRKVMQVNNPGWVPLGFIELPQQAAYEVYVGQAWETAQAWASEQRRLTGETPDVWGDGRPDEMAFLAPSVLNAIADGARKAATGPRRPREE